MTQQALLSVLRQILAVTLIVFGALTAALQGIHLPVAVSTVMAAIGGGLFWIEHYVADPSTGTPGLVIPHVTKSELDNAYRAGFNAARAPQANVPVVAVPQAPPPA